MLFISMINALISQWVKVMSKNSLTQSLVQQENQAMSLNTKVTSKNTNHSKPTSGCCSNV